MKIRPGNAQHQGAREAQQDSFGFSDLDDAAFVAHAGFLGVVADGMGGLAHGGAAGALAVRALLDTYAAKRVDQPLSAALLDALLRANDAVVALARDTKGIGDVGTTAAVAVVHGAALHWIAAGDSRVYLWRAGRLTQVTTDHVYAADLDAQLAGGQISEQAAREDPDRDALTSHLGTPSLRRIDRSLEPYPLIEGDRVLICSDGVYRALDLDELAAPLAGAPQRACETLVERAVAKGHPRQDNLTALVIGLDGDGVRSESGEWGVSVTATPTPSAPSASGASAAQVRAEAARGTSGVATHGSTTPGSTTPGSTTPGSTTLGNTPPGNTPLGSAPPGNTPRGNTPHGSTTGGVTTSGVTNSDAMTSDVTASDAAASDVATNDGTAGDVTVGDVSTGEARGSRGANGRRPRPAAANFDIAALSRTAGRAANEDYADFLQAGAAGCWVIADGLGGHRGGATASKTVVQAALDSFRRQPEITIDAVSAHIARAQEALLEAQRQEPSLSQMRSTIVVLLADESEAVWAHVGDSRLYHLRGGKIVARTRDHSVGQALVDGGQIDPAAQGSHEDRSRLLRCLGKADEASAAISGPHRLARGDVFLLCTDGFWEALDDVSLSIDLAASADAAAWLDRLEARLRRRIGAEHDNYTATAIRILNEAIPPPPPHDPRAPAFDALPPSAAMGPTGVVGVRGVTAVTGVTGVTGVGQHETMAITLRDRVPRAAIVAAIALVAVLAAAGVWKRAAISAWVRALMPPAGAVAPTEGTPKKAPIESETKPDAMPKTTPDTKPVTKPQARPDAESDPASDDKPDVTPDAATSSSALSRPRGGHQSAAAASTNAQGAKKAKSQRDATARDGAKNQDDAKNQQNVKKRDASAPDPPPSHSAPIARPRPPAPPPSTPPREEVR